MRYTLFVVLALTAACGGSSHRETRKTERPPAKPVRTTSVQPESWPVTHDATGTVKARTSATLSAKVMGNVREIYVRAGDTVRAGQLLVTIEARDLDAQYRQAEEGRNEARAALPEVENGIAAAKAQLDLAQTTFKRMEDLLAKRSISQQEFDEAASRLRAAQAQHQMAESRRAQLQARLRGAEERIQAAQIQRDYARLMAPFAGIVIERQGEPGMLAAPGVPLLTIEQPGAYRLEANVEESRLPSIRLGQNAPVALDALDQKLDGRVAEIVPVVDPASRTFLVKLDLPQVAQLRSGLFGRVQFASGQRPTIAIPAGALREQGQLNYVFVAENGTARQRLVTTGMRRADRIEILSGLQAGDALIGTVPPGLADGDPVEVRP